MKRGATKEEIIRITQELITRNGIRAVRVDEIAQTLGTIFEMRINNATREESYLFCRTILRGAATREGVERIDSHR